MRKECMNQEEGAAFSSPLDRRSALAPLGVNKVGASTKKKLSSDIITCQKETVSVDLGGKLKTLIETLHVTKLLVFLSHTDEDHINLIGHLPDVPAIFCVGGNVSSEKDTYLNSLLKDKQHAYRFDTYNRKLVVNTSCGDFLRKLLKDDTRIDLQYFKHINVLQKLSFLHLWLLNPHKSDVNSQSYIISATLEQQNMTMVFSGDATTSTFEMLKTELTTDDQPVDDIIRRKVDKRDHNVLFSVPHHGSHRHFPKQIFRMFEPSAYLVNSGNGASYPHPHKDLVSYLASNTKPEYVQKFWDTHTLTADSAACTFSRTADGVGKDERILPILRHNNPSKLLVLGTNISGAIYIDSRGAFSQDYSNSLEIQGQDYSVQYNRHSFSGYLKDGKFQFAPPYNRAYKSEKFSYSEQDEILYKNSTPYAKMYYTPVSKKWFGYLLQAVTPHKVTTEDEDTNPNFGPLCLFRDASFAQLVAPVAA